MTRRESLHPVTRAANLVAFLLLDGSIFAVFVGYLGWRVFA